MGKNEQTSASNANGLNKVQDTSQDVKFGYNNKYKHNLKEDDGYSTDSNNPQGYQPPSANSAVHSSPHSHRAESTLHTPPTSAIHSHPEESTPHSPSSSNLYNPTLYYSSGSHLNNSELSPYDKPFLNQNPGSPLNPASPSNHGLSPHYNPGAHSIPASPTNHGLPPQNNPGAHSIPASPTNHGLPPHYNPGAHSIPASPTNHGLPPYYNPGAHSIPASPTNHGPPPHYSSGFHFNPVYSNMQDDGFYYDHGPYYNSGAPNSYGYHYNNVPPSHYPPGGNRYRRPYKKYSRLHPLYPVQRKLRRTRRVLNVADYLIRRKAKKYFEPKPTNNVNDNNANTASPVHAR